MKAGAVLINTARGPVVDERALVAALQAGQVARAALDVFEDEPLPLDSPLLQMDNVMLSPHSANSSPEAWEHVHQNTVKNLIQGLTQYSIMLGHRRAIDIRDAQDDRLEIWYRVLRRSIRKSLGRLT